MATNGKYITLTDDNFKNEVIESDQPVLVDFWATWCGPCRIVAPIIEELASDFDGRAKVGKVDVDHNMRVAGEYGIRSIPTLLFFKDGRVVDQIVGAAQKRVLTEKLENLLQTA
jgi:thioredoxin 1